MEYAKFQLCPEKLDEAVIYLAERSADDPNFGEAKLLKLLYYSDCASFFRCWEPITGATYIHLAGGPCPQGWESAKRQLLDKGAISEANAVMPDGNHRPRIVAKRAAKPEILTGAERAFIDQQQQGFANCAASDIDEHIRRVTGWEMTKVGEEMPYELSMFSQPVPTDDVIERGNRIIADFIKWLQPV